MSKGAKLPLGPQQTHARGLGLETKTALSTLQEENLKLEQDNRDLQVSLQSADRTIRELREQKPEVVKVYDSQKLQELEAIMGEMIMKERARADEAEAAAAYFQREWNDAEQRLTKLRRKVNRFFKFKNYVAVLKPAQKEKQNEHNRTDQSGSGNDPHASIDRSQRETGQNEVAGTECTQSIPCASAGFNN